MSLDFGEPDGSLIEQGYLNPRPELAQAERERDEALAELRALRRTRYRFEGRGTGPKGEPIYVWHAVRQTDSRVEQIICGVDWFWRTP